MATLYESTLARPFVSSPMSNDGMAIGTDGRPSAAAGPVLSAAAGGAMDAAVLAAALGAPELVEPLQAAMRIAAPTASRPMARFDRVEVMSEASPFEAGRFAGADDDAAG